MKIKDSSQILSSVATLTRLAEQKKLITPVQAAGYLTLSKHDPIIIFGLLCQNLYSLGASNLYKDESGVISTLNVCYPTFAKFIARVTLSKADRFGARVNFKYDSVERLIKIALEYGLITIEEKEMYEDLISWKDENYLDVEMDILIKMYDWDYSTFKTKAPKILEHIKLFFPEWFEILVKPYEEGVKQRIRKDW